MAARRKVAPKPSKKPAPIVEMEDSEEESEDDFEDEDEEDSDEFEGDEEFDNEDEPDEDEEDSDEKTSSPEAGPADPTPPRAEPEPRRPRSIPGGRGTPEDRARKERVRTELVRHRPDISSWLTSGEAAKLVNRHPKTLKNWRDRGRINPELDESGCWRYNPDELLEIADEPDPSATDPASVMALGMSQIVTQGEKAGDRLVTMTEVTTAGLEKACEILSAQLEAAWTRVAELEKKLNDALDRGMNNLEASYKHERWLKKLQYEHEKEMAGEKDKESRLLGLLQILGPIGATLAQKVVASSDPPSASREPQASSFSRLDTKELPFEARVTSAMGALELALRTLDDARAKAIRLMVPEDVQRAFDVIRTPEAPGDVRGSALALVAKSAVGLSEEQFKRLYPLVPVEIADAFLWLRDLNAEKEEKT